MKKAILLALALLSTAATARAAIVTFEYTARIDELSERDIWGPSVGVGSSDWAGFTIGTGATITGRLSYDDNTPMRLDNDSWPRDRYIMTNVNTNSFLHSVTFDESGVTAASNTGGLSVRDTDNYDALEVRSGMRGAPSGWSINADFHVPRAGFQSGALFTTQELHDVRPYALWATFAEVGGYGVLQATGTVTSFRVISSVPEPSTYAMLLAGAVPLLLRRRKA